MTHLSFCFIVTHSCPHAVLRLQIKSKNAQLVDLRAGVPPISEQELAQLDVDWAKWKAEWVRRRKVYSTCVRALYHPFPRDLFFFCRLWHLVTDALAPQDSAALAEDLGIELDTSEHQVLERSALFTACNAKTGTLKRKRDPES